MKIFPSGLQSEFSEACLLASFRLHCHMSIDPTLCLLLQLPHMYVNTHTSHVLVRANKNIPGPNKDHVTVFVRGSSKGSQVVLSEVKITEAPLPFDSLRGGGGHEGEQ